LVTLGFLSGFGSFSFLVFSFNLCDRSFLSKFLALLAGVHTGFLPSLVFDLPHGS
jgi:hypothetical protein